MSRKSLVPFHLQQDQFDCGVACLRNILNYYSAEISLEKLREWSGAGAQGTSLLGLFNAAGQAGFKAEGARAGGLADLRELGHPCILHVTIDNAMQHYVVFYPKESDERLLIGDPARGLIHMKPEELEKIWTGKTLLLLEPEERLSRWQEQRKKKLRWLWELLKQDVSMLYVALGIGAACAVLSLSTAVFSQQLLDHLLPDGKLFKLLGGLGLLGLLLLMKSLFSYMRQSLLIRQACQFNIRITGGFFRSILYLNKSFFDNRKTGDLIARLNDTIRVQQAVSYMLGDMGIQCLLLLVSLAFLYMYSWPIAIFCTVMIPVLYGIVKYFEKDIIQGQRSVMIAHARNESNYVDSIRGIHTIKVMNRQSFFAGIAQEIFSSFQQAGLRLGWIRIRFNLVLETVTALFLLVVIGWASVSVLHGGLKTGQLVAILQMAGILVQTAVVIALTNLQVQEAAVALDRMYEFTMLEPEFVPADAGQPVIGEQWQGQRQHVLYHAPSRVFSLTIEHIGFRFPGRKALLRDVSLYLEKGEIVALSGESGQGKSTLLQVLQQFYPYEGGAVVVNNMRLEAIDIPGWRKLIGVVPQEIVLFSGSVIANICLDGDANQVERFLSFCREYGFDRYFETFPQSYATMLGEGGVALSGGQRQLLALARCLYGNPELVLLDEPTAAMDAATEQFVIGVLRKYRQRAGMLIISHKDSLTAIADRVYRLTDGVSSPVNLANPVTVPAATFFSGE